MSAGKEERFRTGPVTMREVAARAGVAPATVSNVLTGRRQVRQELRERVLAAIEALGYRPNQLASSLRSSRSHAIGILVPDLTNPFFAALVHRLEDLAAADGYQILLAGSNEGEERETERLHMLLSRRIDGLILAPSRDATPIRAARNLHLPPTILMDRGFGQSEFDAVGVDNAEAVREGCRHLVALGHHDIAFLVSSDAISNMRERIDGYISALDEVGLGARARVIQGGFTVETCRAAIEQELRRAEPPTAIFAAFYVGTLGAVKAIRGLDLDLPRQVSLLGFDDSDWMTVLRPYLSVVVQPVEDMAEQAWSLLKHRLKNSDAPSRQVRLPCRLAVRESTQRPGVEGRIPEEVSGLKW